MNSNNDVGQGEDPIPWYLRPGATQPGATAGSAAPWLKSSGDQAPPLVERLVVASEATPHAKAVEPENDIALDSLVEAANPDALFSGDTGRLKAETRRTLVQLLSGPSVDGRRQPLLWTVLLRDRRDIASRLNELFLELVIDTDQRVAFIRQPAVSGDEDLPILLRRQPLTFIESALVLHLRQRLTEADRADERAVIGLQEILEHLEVFEKAANNDGAKFDKQCMAAVEKVKALSLLRQIRGSEGRFEISPTLKLLFSAEEVIALTQSYERLKTPSGADSPDDPQGTEDGLADTLQTDEAA